MPPEKALQGIGKGCPSNEGEGMGPVDNGPPVTEGTGWGKGFERDLWSQFGHSLAVG